MIWIFLVSEHAFPHSTSVAQCVFMSRFLPRRCSAMQLTPRSTLPWCGIKEQSLFKIYIAHKKLLILEVWGEHISGVFLDARPWRRSHFGLGRPQSTGGLHSPLPFPKLPLERDHCWALWSVRSYWTFSQLLKFLRSTDSLYLLQEIQYAHLKQSRGHSPLFANYVVIYLKNFMKTNRKKLKLLTLLWHMSWAIVKKKLK